MKDSDIRKAFDSIKADNVMKSRILNNIYDEIKKDKSNILEGRCMITKRLLPALALSIIIIGGTFLYYRNSNTNTVIPSPPTACPPLNEEYVPDVEFNNFDIQTLKEKTIKIEIKNHENTALFKEITNRDFIDESLVFLQNIKTKNENLDSEKDKEIAYKLFEDIAHSQAIGNSITLSFITKDNVKSSVRVNIDLDIICINEKYFDVSSGFIKLLKSELKTIKNLNEINTPGQN